MPHIAVRARGTIDIQKLLESKDKAEVKLGLKMREVDLEKGNNDGKLQRKEAEQLSPRYRKQYEKLIAAAADKEPVAAKAKHADGQGAMALQMSEKSGTKKTKKKKSKPVGARAVTNLFTELSVPRQPAVPASFESPQAKNHARSAAQYAVNAMDLKFDALDDKIEQMIVKAYGKKRGAELNEAWTQICTDGAEGDVDPNRMARVVDKHWPHAPQVIKEMAQTRRSKARALHKLEDLVSLIDRTPASFSASAPSREARTLDRREPVERVVYRDPPKKDIIEKCGDIANSATENFGIVGFAATYPLGLANFFFGK